MNWLQRTLSHLGEPSTKRHVVAGAAATLCLVTLAIGSGCAIWIHFHGDLGAGAVGALTFVGGITATLAGATYRKPDGVVAPPAPGGGVVPTVSSTDGSTNA